MLFGTSMMMFLIAYCISALGNDDLATQIRTNYFGLCGVVLLAAHYAVKDIKEHIDLQKGTK